MTKAEEKKKGKEMDSVFMVPGIKTRVRLPSLETLYQHGFGSTKMFLNTNIHQYQLFGEICAAI